MSMYGKNYYNIVISLQLIKKKFHCFTSASLKLMPRFPTVFLLTYLLTYLLTLVQGHYLWGCRGWKAAWTWFWFPLKWWDSPPHWATWNQPINRRPKGNKGDMRESRKARERLSLNKSLRKFVPIELLCKHVTNPLKPATNRLCIPYKFG